MKIPEFPQFIELKIEFQECLINFFRQKQPFISEYNFCDLFAWRNIRNTKISSINDTFLISVEKSNSKYIYYPLCDDLEETMYKILLFYKNKNENIKILSFPDSEINKITKYKEKFIIKDDRDNYDYIYYVKDLAELKGRKYEKKRNRIKKFIKEYPDYEFIKLDNSLIKECISFQKKWEDLREKNIESFLNENKAAMEILNNFSNLDCEGFVLKVNNNIIGYIIYSELNSNTAEEILEKADINYDGAYQILNNLFCKEISNKYEFLNRQQDAGDSGLRRAKLSYNPVYLLKKYKISLKDG